MSLVYTKFLVFWWPFFFEKIGPPSIYSYVIPSGSLYYYSVKKKKSYRYYCFISRQNCDTKIEFQNFISHVQFIQLVHITLANVNFSICKSNNIPLCTCFYTNSDRKIVVVNEKNCTCTYVGYTTSKKGDNSPSIYHRYTSTLLYSIYYIIFTGI